MLASPLPSKSASIFRAREAGTRAFKMRFSRPGTILERFLSRPQIGYEGDGEAIFPSSENYVVKSSGVITDEGKASTTRSTITAKWLAADCGDLKPPEVKR